MSDPIDSSYDLAPVPPPVGEKSKTDPRSVAPSEIVPAGLPRAPESTAQTQCPHCGFRIVGKPHNNRCPDCNAALDEVTTGLLQFAPTAWTRSVSNGALVICAAVLLHAAGFMVVFLRLRQLNSNLVHTIGATVLLLGTWLLTRRPPNDSNRTSRLAIAARVLSGVALLSWAVAIPHSAGAITSEAAALLTLAAYAFALCFYASELSGRIPSDGLVQHFRLLPYVLCAFFVALMIADMADPLTLRSYLELFFCSFPMLGAMAAILLWGVITFLRLAIELRQAAAAADAIVARRQRALANQKRPPGKN